jgi:hypothetical protein
MYIGSGRSAALAAIALRKSSLLPFQGEQTDRRNKKNFFHTKKQTQGGSVKKAEKTDVIKEQPPSFHNTD